MKPCAAQTTKKTNSRKKGEWKSQEGKFQQQVHKIAQHTHTHTNIALITTKKSTINNNKIVVLRCDLFIYSFFLLLFHFFSF